MQHPPNSYLQPGSFGQPRPPRRNPWQWYRRRHPALQVGIGCLSLLVLLFVGLFCTAFVAVATGHGAQPTPTSHVAAVSTPTSSQARATTVSATAKQPTATSTVAPTPTATATPTSVSTVKPTPVPTKAPPAPTPTPNRCPNAVNHNPWCYDFSPGNLIYYPPDGFCNYFNCIATFYASDDPGDGYIIECQDGTFSQSGGESGSCSHHGGNMRPLYSH